MKLVQFSFAVTEVLICARRGNLKLHILLNLIGDAENGILLNYVIQ